MGIAVPRCVAEHALLVETVRRRWPAEAEAIFAVERRSPYSLSEIDRYIQRRLSRGATVKLALRDVRAARRARRPLPSL